MNRGRHKTKSYYGSKWLHKVLSKEEMDHLIRGQRMDNNPPDLSIFERKPYAGMSAGGFNFRLYASIYYVDVFKITDKINLYKINNKL